MTIGLILISSLLKGIKKWLPTNQLDNYHFVTDLDNSIDDTLKSKIKGSNRYSEDCYLTQNNFNIPRVPYDDESFSIEDKKKGLNRAISTLKGFQMREFDINKRLTQEGYNVGVKFELADLITDLTIKSTLLDNQPKVIIKEDEESKRLAEQKSKELEKEKARRIAEEKERKNL